MPVMPFGYLFEDENEPVLLEKQLSPSSPEQEIPKKKLSTSKYLHSFHEAIELYLKWTEEVNSGDLEVVLILKSEGVKTSDSGHKVGKCQVRD